MVRFFGFRIGGDVLRSFCHGVGFVFVLGGGVHLADAADDVVSAFEVDEAHRVGSITGKHLANERLAAPALERRPVARFRSVWA